MEKDARKEYGEIIDHPHYVDPFRTPMSRLNRAAQFSPFAALTGYEDLIDEAARQTDEQIVLDESAKEEIGNRLQALLHTQPPRPVEITCFIPDGKKSGGAYRTFSGYLQSCDETDRSIRLESGEQIPIDWICGIS